MLKDVKILTVFEFRIFFTEKPREHLPRFHAGSDYAPAFVPLLLMVSVFVVVYLQSNLS